MITAIGRTVREGVEGVGRAGHFVAESAGATRELRTWLPLATTHARALGVNERDVGVAARIAASSRPCPPPTSTIVRNGVKS